MRPQRLLFEGTSKEKYCAMSTVEFCISVSLVAVLAFACTTDKDIVVLNVEGLASALIRNVALNVKSANLSGKAQRAAAMEAERARVQVEMVCRVQPRRLHPSRLQSVL